MKEAAEMLVQPLFADLPPAKSDPAPGASQARRDIGQKSYFNTTGQTGDQLAEYRERAATQEAVILQFFQEHPRNTYTPSDLTKLLPRAPLTSIRRAVTDLTRQGLLEKTTSQKNGIYNRPEHKWRLKEGVA